MIVFDIANLSVIGGGAQGSLGKLWGESKTLSARVWMISLSCFAKDMFLSFFAH